MCPMTPDEARRIVDALPGGREGLQRMVRQGYLDHRGFCAKLKIHDKLGGLRTPDWSDGWRRMAELVAKHLVLPFGASSDENASYVSVVAADKGQGMSIVGTWQSVYQ